VSSYLFRLQCECGDEAKVNVSYSLPAGLDPRAVALQQAAKRGWVYRNGRMGKSVITVVCPKCKPEPLRLDGDIDPVDAKPATYEEDLAIKGSSD
jgi:hypothetical protein